MTINHLKKLGIDQIARDAVSESLHEGLRLARVTSVNRDRYDIHTGQHEISAEITGKLRATALSGEELPATGDWVYVQLFDDNSFGIIHQLAPRYSILKRKSPGRVMAVQVIAANIDRAFVVQAMDRDFNLRRLERYVAMIYDGAITPYILLSKSDLPDHVEKSDMIRAVNETLPGVAVQAFSSLTGEGVSDLFDLLKPNLTHCLLGSSGVGKTSLLNVLLDEDRFATGEVRRDHKGRHTTTRRQLSFLPNGSILLDTPGMRELGNVGLESGLAATFPEISELEGQCRFSDCQHMVEKGCAILSALKEGQISEERYQSYMKLQRESARNQMALHEKRQRDKALGKYYKSVIKEKKRNR